MKTNWTMILSVDVTVRAAVDRAVSDAVHHPVDSVVDAALDWAVHRAVCSVSYVTVDVDRAAHHPALDDFLADVGAEAP